jgi:GrpB-like predicted nucleotidyltransferase (UPF0157 family)
MKIENFSFDDLPAEQVGRLFPIRIMPYNPEWKMFFEQEKELIAKALGENVALNIEHFGSTSVEGLAAKPTIDILVEIPELNEESKQYIIQRLGTIGYGNMRNAGREHKMTFGKGYDENYLSAQTYHIHIREKCNTLPDEIYFRDCLRQNSTARDEYAKLKYSLAEKYRFNREDYTQAKTGFIIKITEQQKQKKDNNE